ncbi:MAG: hypothetical protein A3H35_08200 [Betaproteobacteria bacterium RIFCSPLOWO2_02_FULL_62_17]|nr:MAG: hypothetical protein A3H35_08200 [Betaproteobacteria bacterium RIFCSPLOWO2_02_FULL_62_17]
MSRYEVVSPAGDARDARGAAKKTASAAPLAGMNGKRLGLCWTAFTNGDIVLRAFRDHLAGRYPDLEFVELMPGRGLRWGDHPDPSIAELVREERLDAALITAGC